MRKELDDIWLKAAVAGGLWASFEIIVGSFLHNLHIPFSGTILATFSVILMIAFLQIWKENGLIWRAGLICGLMKSLSPSAVILGPMTGIMMEAAFLNLFIYLIGRNVPGYILGGIAALLSTILHKLASLFILYGTDLVKIYTNLFYFIQKQLGGNEAPPESLLWWILLLYALLGTLAALVGYFLGQRAMKNAPVVGKQVAGKDPFAEQWNKVDPSQKFRIILLFVHLLMIPAQLVLINQLGLSWPVLLIAGLYLGFLLIYYPRIKYRLLKPMFWSQLLIMILVAMFFWHPPGEEQHLLKGFLAGLEMSLRATLIVSAFSALSVEIRNPRVGRLFSQQRFSRPYAALSLAFNSLPAMLERSAGIKEFLRNPFKAFTSMLRDAGSWLKCYETPGSC